MFIFFMDSSSMLLLHVVSDSQQAVIPKGNKILKRIQQAFSVKRYPPPIMACLCLMACLFVHEGLYVYVQLTYKKAWIF